ncbi:MAG TPA: MarR family transcriptional regulator [Steroidobacteraceae bacterium]|nr:MarR family transcriptional regulator [Steroidobacteraceae bacterium]
MPPDRLRNLGFLIRDVSRLYGRHFERRARELELTLAQCKVLAHLSRNEGVSQARLAELTETDPMTLVRTLDRMQQDHWLERRPDPTDRRAHRLYLREEAKPVLARMWKIAEQARGEAISALSAQECEQLLELLGRLHEQLQALDARASDARRPLHAQPALAADGRAK